MRHVRERARRIPSPSGDSRSDQGFSRQLHRLAVAVLALLSASSGLAEDRRFLVVSDIHAFACQDDGPCADAAKICDDASNAATIACAHPSHIDTDGCLFDSFLQDLACTQKGRASFMLIPGDWIAHGYGAPGDSELKHGIIETVTKRLAEQLPNTLIVPALGNNDAYLGDYNLAPCLDPDPAGCRGTDGLFLRDTLALWRPLIDGADEVGTACLADPTPGTDYLEASFLKGGYYAIANPHLPNNCTLVLNTVLLLQDYIAGNTDRGIAAHGTQAAEAQLAWLRARLDFARRPPGGGPPRNVWMIYHVPPGANTYSSSSDQSVSMMFSSDAAHDYAAEFTQLLAEYSDVVEAAFGGHTHLDSFRILRRKDPQSGSDRAVSFVHIAPSLTPSHHKNHAAYQWLTYDAGATSTRIENVYTRRVALSGGSAWQQEYAWSQTYCQPCDYDDEALAAVYRSLRDPKLRSHAHDKHYYTLYYAEGDYSSISDQAQWPWYVCAIGNLDAKAYEACVEAVRSEQSLGTPEAKP